MISSNIKQEIKRLIASATSSFDWGDTRPLTANILAAQLGVSRNLVSQYLNELALEGDFIKIKTRPVLFLDCSQLQKRFGVPPSKPAYSSAEELRGFFDGDSSELIFERLIGSSSSMSYCVEQCKSAVIYPPNGLPLLLYGPTGTGKSFIAGLTQEYALQKKLVTSDKELLIVNCSEYANNPELLTANLFGHKKGAFTDADRDNPGLVALADGGFIFLDEVHCLRAECQEKLFLFMDKGIYHMVGDNKNWYGSSARLIFATTEEPQRVLLPTLLRRIPIVATLPSLSERPIFEKRDLIHSVLMQERSEIGRELSITSRAYQALLDYPFAGNVGELKNSVRVSCANAFLHSGKNNEGITIHFFNLPGCMMDYFATKDIKLRPAFDKNVCPVGQLQVSHGEKSLLIETSEQLLALSESAQDSSAFLASAMEIFGAYMERVIFGTVQAVNPRVEIFTQLIAHICSVVAGKYYITLHNNDVTAIAKLMNDCRDYMLQTEQFLSAHRAGWGQFRTRLTTGCSREYPMAQDICTMLLHGTDIQMGDMGVVFTTLFLKSLGHENDVDKIPGIIVAHGYSTASSIADAANTLLRRYVFEAIDMPLEMDMETIVVKLAEYFKKFTSRSEAVLLVDMGSLEGMHLRLRNIDNITLGIINNVTTRLAIDVGSLLMSGLPMERALDTACRLNTHSYLVLNRKSEQDAILVVCVTGEGTAAKISQLIEKSLPKGTDLKLITGDYDSYVRSGRALPVFSRYNILAVVGTVEPPQVEDVPFISLEELMADNENDRLCALVSQHLTPDEGERFKQNLVKEFSMENLLNYLTILNPAKVIDLVDTAINTLETKMNMSFRSNTRVGLYVHICCLVERLLTHKEISACTMDLKSFSEEYADLIACIKQSLSVVERHYSVEIPISEIGYIKDFICHDKPLSAVSGGDNDFFD